MKKRSNSKDKGNNKLLDTIIKVIKEKKGQKTISLDLRNVTSAICDYFIICQGNSTRHVKTITESIEKTVKLQTGESPWHIEGVENLKWVLIDYIDIVVHVFTPETRTFYNLEELWADAEIIKYDEQKNIA